MSHADVVPWVVAPESLPQLPYAFRAHVTALGRSPLVSLAFRLARGRRRSEELSRRETPRLRHCETDRRHRSSEKATSEPVEHKVPASAMRERLEVVVNLGELVGAVDEQWLEWDQHAGHLEIATVANPINVRLFMLPRQRRPSAMLPQIARSHDAAE
jgi:hypothetical protein